MSGSLTTDRSLTASMSALAATSRLLVCCDFDGTISLLADEPRLARPVDGAVQALGSLASLRETWTAIISGRALIDLTQLAGMPPDVHLVGSHGNEFEIGALIAVEPTGGPTRDQLVDACRDVTVGIPGILIEAKPASVAVHVRRSPPGARLAALAAVRTGPGALPGVRVIEGRDVVELALFPGGKGDALAALRHRWNATGTLFIGDDVTDESGFAALADGDMAIKVGDGTTLAPWRLPGPHAVVEVLAQLALARGERPTSEPPVEGPSDVLPASHVPPAPMG